MELQAHQAATLYELGEVTHARVSLTRELEMLEQKHVMLIETLDKLQIDIKKMQKNI